MIVVNEEPRIIILGDRVRVGRNPGAGTRFNPGASVNIKDVPEYQRERFVEAVHRAIAKKVKLKVFGEEVVSSEQLQEAARKRDAEAALEAGRRALAAQDEDKPKRGRPPRKLGEPEPTSDEG